MHSVTYDTDKIVSSFILILEIAELFCACINFRKIFSGFIILSSKSKLISIIINKKKIIR